MKDVYYKGLRIYISHKDNIFRLKVLGRYEGSIKQEQCESISEVPLAIKRMEQNIDEFWDWWKNK